MGAGVGDIFSTILDKDNHMWGSSLGAGSCYFSFLGGLRNDSNSLCLSDIAHHHMGVGCLLIIGGHIFTSLHIWIGHRIRNILVTHGNNGLINHLTSLHLSLCLSLFSVGQITSTVAQHSAAMPSFAFISRLTGTALFC